MYIKLYYFSETSIKTVIEVQSSKPRISIDELPQEDDKSTPDENLPSPDLPAPVPVQNDDRRGSRGRSIAPLHVRRKGQSAFENNLRLNMKRVNYL